MKPLHKLCKVIMCLSPGSLLSAAAKERCIANLSELPSFLQGGTMKNTAAVLVPLCLDKGEVSLLYTLRSAQLSSHSGQVSFPGGKIDKNETEYEAALRETKEEIGVPAEDIDIWTKMSKVQGRNSSVVITPVVGVIKNFDFNKLVPNEAEVAEIFTIPMQVLCDPANHGCYKYKTIGIPVFTGGKHTVWGITGMITHIFLQSFLPSSLYCPDFTKKEYNLNELMPAKL